MTTSDSLLNIGGWRRLPIVRQAEAAECGLACLAMIANWYGNEIDLLSLRRRFPMSLKGITLRELIDIAARMGLGGRALRCDLKALAKLRTPTILHWDFKHFVVLKRVRGNRVWLHDPELGIRVLSMDEVSSHFTGVALELTPTATFERKRERQPVRMSQLWQWTPDTRSTALQGLLLSLVLQLFVLLTPFYMQLVLDDVILKGDGDLLVGLAAGFGLLAIFNAIASALRSLVFQFLGNVMSFGMEARLFHHLTRLPLDYFQKRSLGDVLQRFQSLQPVRNFIISGGITAIVDGLLAIFTGALMLVYSPLLGLIVMGVVALYILLRIAVMPMARRLETDAIVASTREQGAFLETVRAVQTIKVFGGESAREVTWRNLLIEKLNTGLRSGNLDIAYGTVNGLLTALSDIAIVYIAARQAMDGQMSVGLLTAFMAYKGQFMSKMSSLVNQVIEYRMLDVQLDRVADIALAEREPDADALMLDDTPIEGGIKIRDLDFAYSQREAPVLQNVNVEIAAGSFVAIVGSSGAGKSTLLKLMIGLNTPTRGEVLIDGRPLSQISMTRFRSQLGVVMQEDQLLAGTIAENIALFDERIDFQRMRRCAQLAAIDDEIMQHPMQYNSLVGDMGSTLSSGQKQRVLIARALYREPRILVFDEGTAHLDPDRAECVHRVLKQIPVTRVVVAHSPAMMLAADHVLELREGTLHEVDRATLERP